MNIVIIAAVSENNIIGYQGKIPWHIPEDLKRFKELTSGNAVIMGRKTYDSIGKPLPKRTNIVVTRNKNFEAKGISVAHSLEDAIKQSQDFGRAYIIGGQQIYEQAMPLADKLELTLVHKAVQGDSVFPKINYREWKETSRTGKQEYSFVTYTKF